MSNPTAKAKGKSLYSIHPAIAYQEAVIANMAEKTGKALEDWLRIVKGLGPPAKKERLRWLKKQHKLGMTTAMIIAERAEGKVEEYDPEALVEAMFAGPKAALRPIYDELLKLGLGLGKEAKACPGKTMVSLYREHVFAELKPSTQTRINLGLALGKTKAQKRLIDTGGFAKGDRITHRIPITKLQEIDDVVKRWLKAAYELDA